MSELLRTLGKEAGKLIRNDPEAVEEFLDVLTDEQKLEVKNYMKLTNSNV